MGGEGVGSPAGRGWSGWVGDGERVYEARCIYISTHPVATPGRLRPLHRASLGSLRALHRQLLTDFGAAKIYARALSSIAVILTVDRLNIRKVSVVKSGFIKS